MKTNSKMRAMIQNKVRKIRNYQSYNCPDKYLEVKVAIENSTE